MTERITRADIVEASLALLAGGGLHALVMRRIANELGIQQSALYWHFDNKQQLLGAIADQIVSPVEVREARDWPEQIVTLASRLRSELLRLPDGAELVATVFAFRLGAQQPFRQFTAVLAQAGLPPDDADIAASVLFHFVLGYATDEQQHQQAATLGAIEPDNEKQAGPRADDRFVRGLRLIIAGLDLQIRDTSAASPAEQRR